jgi:adenosine deaminase
MSKQLVTLRDDVFDEFDFEEYKMDIQHPFLNIYDELVKYEQNAILRVLHAKGMVDQAKKEEAVKKLHIESLESKKLVTSNNNSIKISFSYGTEDYKQGVNFGDVFDKADKKMYKMKEDLGLQR